MPAIYLGLCSITSVARFQMVRIYCVSKIWRRRRDSNPRDPFGSNGFQDRRFQPLTHSSVSNSNVFRECAANVLQFLNCEAVVKGEARVQQLLQGDTSTLPLGVTKLWCEEGWEIAAASPCSLGFCMMVLSLRGES